MSKPSCVRVHGPLAPHADGFREELAHQGYTPHSASYHLQLMAHVSRWLVAKSLDATRSATLESRISSPTGERRATRSGFRGGRQHRYLPTCVRSE